MTGGTFAKFGANIEATSDGKHAEISSPDRKFTDGERGKILESMQAFYDQFVEKVAEARHTTPEKIDQIAQGRVWTGQQAKHVGLVDRLGGLQDAIAVAKQRANVAADAEIELVVYPPRRSFYEVLSESFDSPAERSTSESILSLLGARDRRALAALLAPSRLFRSGEVLAYMPVRVSSLRVPSSKFPVQSSCIAYGHIQRVGALDYNFELETGNWKLMPYVFLR